MRLLSDIFVALLCGLGLGFLGWLLFGRLLRPIPDRGIRALIPGQGDGDSLEQAVRALIWLRGLGLLDCPIIIADLGLTHEGRELALRLALRWPGVVLWPGSDLADYIART